MFWITLFNMILIRFILSVGYKHEAFATHFANDYKGCLIIFSIEKEPLGTGGGIKKALDSVETPEVLVLNADTFFRIGFKWALSFS